MVNRARLNPFSLDWRRFIVAESAQGQVIGCGQIKPHADGSRELASLVVAPDWQLRGVARTIIMHLLENHPKPIYLTCRASLGLFYVKFGFRVIEEAGMPLYFCRISRVYRWWKRWLGWLNRDGEGLLVMKIA
jgi:N-acetylglutamate synthase-like GNAT family acetyltransferase